MLPLTDPAWSELHHAFGPAADVPTLLERATAEPDCTQRWTELWDALCHQGDTYSASFAAVPHLVRVAAAWPPELRVEPLLLVAGIEQSRLEGQGPGPRPSEQAAYEAALATATALAQATLPLAPAGGESERALRILLAVTAGDLRHARQLLGEEGEDEAFEAGAV